MARKQILNLVLVLACSIQSAQATETSVRFTHADGTPIAQAELKPSITPIVGDYVTTPKFDMEALGASIAKYSLIERKRQREEGKKEFRAKHKVIATIGKYTGMNWFDDHIVCPLSDASEQRQGAVTLAGVTASWVGAGAILGGAARGK